MREGKPRGKENCGDLLISSFKCSPLVPIMPYVYYGQYDISTRHRDELCERTKKFITEVIEFIFE